MTADRLQARVCGLPGLSAQNAACKGPVWRRDASSEGEWICGVDTSGWLVLSLQFAETFARPGGLHLRGDQLVDNDSQLWFWVGGKEQGGVTCGFC